MGFPAAQMDTAVKIHLAKYEPDRVGGGWSFMRNFAKGVTIYPYEEAEIYFISSPSMVTREEVQKAKDDKKIIVLRIDNAVRNSRNRNSGMSRMFDFAQMADLIVFQSKWARDYLQPFLHKKGQVILNGVDTTLYRPNNIEPDRNFIFYSRFNRDETKNWEVARFWFSQYHLRYPDSRLYIAGQFSPELRDANFDFYNNEGYQYVGVLPPDEIAAIYRLCGSFLYTYFNDACSNTLIEALCSGCLIVGDSYYLTTGGAPEITDMFDQYGSAYFTIERMCHDYLKAIEAI